MRDPWKDANKAKLVIDALSSVLTLNADGSVGLGWNNDSRIGFDLLTEYYRFPKDIPPNIRYKAMRGSIVASVQATALSLSGIHSRVSAALVDYHRQPNQVWILRSSLSLKSSKDQLNSISLPRARIAFYRKVPKAFALEPFFARNPPGKRATPNQYYTVLTRVEGRDALAAGQQAIRAIDYIRSIWNFALNRGKQRFSSGDTPLNAILFGPLHTLHDASGKHLEHPSWYEPDFIEPLRLFDYDRDWKGLKGYERNMKRSIDRARHSDLLRNLLIRYGRALDDRNQNSALLQMWSLLEALTSTPNANHALTVQRASFIAPSPAFHRLGLEYLRHWRNKIVHEGGSSENAEMLCTEARQYVEQLYIFFLNHSRHFTGLEDFGHFLDSPQELAAIRRRRKHLGLALRTRQHMSGV